MKVRPYQQRLTDAVLAKIAQGKSRVILQMPTGSGKTACAVELSKSLPKPILFLAHTRELVNQSYGAFRDAGFGVDMLTADVRTDAFAVERFVANSDITVASQMTAWSRGVRAGHVLGEYKSIIADECHRATARTWQEIFKLYPEAKIIGLTATPIRSDGNGLGLVFDDMVCGADHGASSRELINEGYLVDAPLTHIWSWPADMSGVKVLCGDYQIGGKRGAAERVDNIKRVGDCVSHWLKLAVGRPTIVYASSVDHAYHLRDKFVAEGVRAEAVDGGTPSNERDSALEKLGNGNLDIIANFGVIVEGFDCPAVSCIVLERPTLHFGLFMQMVGRGLRPAAGKSDLMILDHVGLTLPAMHGLPTQDVQWGLSATQQAVLPESKSKSPTPPPIPCPSCNLAIRGRPPCRFCGWMPSAQIDRGKESATVSGELVRLSDLTQAKVDKIYGDPRRAEFYRLKKAAKKNGRSDGWPHSVWKSKHGDWPPVDWDLPNPEKISDQKYYNACRYFAYRKSFKSGWAAYQYRKIYGDWPPKDYAGAYDRAQLQQRNGFLEKQQSA